MGRRSILAGALLVTVRLQASAAEGNRYPQPLPVGSFPGRVVQQPLESQPVLGFVRDVVRLADGTTAIVIDHGGLLARFGGLFGIGSRRVAVPLDAMSLLGPQLVLTGLKPEQLDALPTYAGDGAPIARTDTVPIGLIKPSH